MSDPFSKQFNALLSERDAHNAAAATAERERRREEQTLSSHRSAAQHLLERLNVSKSKEGEVARKLQNLNEAKLRLKKAIDSERAEIVKVTDELRGKEHQEREQKRAFVKEMEVMNDELDDLLCKVENEKVLRLIDGETVQWLLETKLGGLVERASVGMDENYVEAENEKWREIRGKIEEAAGELADADEKVKEGIREKAELEKMLRALREKFGMIHPVSSDF
jgi:chromosome segregation ATPase